MTATQIFLRFVQDEYTNSDGTIDAALFNLWRRDLKLNNIVAKREYKRGNVIGIRKSVNFVDDYLIANNRTLNGFIKHYHSNRYYAFSSARYGWTTHQIENKLSRLWRTFLSQHINEANLFKCKWTLNNYKKFVFSWKE